MDKVIVTKQKITSVADAIRNKSGTSNTLTLDAIPEAINNLSGEDMDWIIEGKACETFKFDGLKIRPYLFCIPNTSAPSDSYRFTPKIVDFPNVTKIGGYAFYAALSNSSNLPFESFNAPKLQEIGYGSFRKFFTYGIVTLDFPELKTIDTIGFGDCYNLNKINVPKLEIIGINGFTNCSDLREIELPSVKKIETTAFKGCSKLEKVVIPGNVIPSVEADTFDENSCIYVPTAMYDEYTAATNWISYYKKGQLRAMHDSDLEEIYLLAPRTINSFFIDNEYNISVEYNNLDNAKDEYRGVTYECIGNATITETGVLKLTSNAKDGDEIIIKATSTYDSSIIATANIYVEYSEVKYTINLNDGQWEYTGNYEGTSPVYKSNVGSYNIKNGISKARVDILKNCSLTVYIRSYAESSYDYTEIGKLDTDATRGANSNVLSTQGKQSETQYYSYTFNITDGQPHYFDIIYSKDSSGDKNDDRGYFYIVES